jgi:hypothetical protein
MVVPVRGHRARGIRQAMSASCSESMYSEGAMDFADGGRRPGRRASSTGQTHADENLLLPSALRGRGAGRLGRGAGLGAVLRSRRAAAGRLVGPLCDGAAGAGC